MWLSWMFCALRKLIVTTAMLLGMVGTPVAFAEGPVRLVTFSFPPYIYAEAGKPAGVLVEVVNEAFTRMGQPIFIEIMPTGRAWNMYVSGVVDGSFTMKMTAERKTTMLFTRVPLVTQDYVFFARKGSGIRFNGDLASVADFRIGSTISLTYGEKFDRAVKSGVIKKVEPLPTLEQNFRKLLADRVSLVISSRLVALDVLKSMNLLDQVEVAGPPIESLPAYLVFKLDAEHEEIAKKFDQAMGAMQKDGTIARIYRLHGLEYH